MRRLFAGLLDDAALFPPASASPAMAVTRHLGHRHQWYADTVGPLLVASASWPQFCRAHEAAGAPHVDVVVIASSRRPPVLPPDVLVVGYETTATSPLDLPLDGTPSAMEIARLCDLRPVLAAVSSARAAGAAVIAKYRTGGTSAPSFPSETDVATVLTSAAAAGVPLKFTAGLHCAVRHTDVTTGFEHHGYLNLMVAVHAAWAGAGEAAIEAVLATRDADALVSRVMPWSHDDVEAVRHMFVSFGCCAIEDPVSDAVRLGLIGPRS